GTQAIADHFDSSRELEVHLDDQGKDDYRKMIQAIPKMAKFAFVRQARHLPYGNGTPLLAAKDFIGENEPFVYMFGDDLVITDDSHPPCTKQLIDVFIQHNAEAVIAFQEVPLSECNRYGMAKLRSNTEPKQLESIVEKPSPEQTPSTLAQLGRFVFS